MTEPEDKSDADASDSSPKSAEPRSDSPSKNALGDAPRSDASPKSGADAAKTRPRHVTHDSLPRSSDPLGLLSRRSSESLEREPRVGPFVAIGLGLALVVGGGLLYRKLAAPEDASEIDAASGSASASVSALPPPPPPRCVDVSQNGGFVVGELPAQKPSANAGASADPAVPSDDPAEATDLAPFAVIFGRAVATEKGFVMGALRDGEGGSLLSVVTLGAEGGEGHTVKLARSRGDLEPPIVVPDGDGVIAAMLEPNASGIALKLARVRGDKVEWGAELDQGRDDSLAIDLATSGENGVVVWDTVKDEKSRIELATFHLASIGTTTAARPVTAESTDADSPRLISRKGGYFLAYIAHGNEIKRPKEAEDDLGNKKNGKGSGDEIDESKGETVVASWVEVIPLDENGSPTASPLRVTPEAGRVAGFDVIGSSDALLIAWRNEESPTGAAGGQVKVARVALSGTTDALTVDEGAGDGIPVLMNGWLSIPTLRGADMLAKVDGDGKTTEPVEAEPSIGRGEPLAAFGDHVLLGEPDGKAMRLRVVRCGAKIVVPKAPDPASSDSP